MKFDGYGATIKTYKSFGGVVTVVADALNSSPSDGPRLPRFGSTTAFNVGPRMAAWMGVNPVSQDIYIEAKGETTPAFVEALRSAFPEHSAPRIDVCEDYNGQGVFDCMVALARQAKGPRVKSGYVALPDDAEDGKTWAAGKRGGVGYLRIYEKGKQPGELMQGRPDWVRAELEARPHYARDKEAAAHMSPVEVWGLSAWTRHVGQRLMQIDVARFEPEIRRYSAEKTTLYIARTFRRHLEEMFANGEDFPRTCRQIWADDDEWRSKNKAH